MEVIEVEADSMVKGKGKGLATCVKVSVMNLERKRRLRKFGSIDVVNVGLEPEAENGCANIESSLVKPRGKSTGQGFAQVHKTNNAVHKSRLVIT